METTEEIELKHREWKAEELKSIHSKGVTSVIRNALECTGEFFILNSLHYPNKASELATLLSKKDFSGKPTLETLRQLINERLQTSGKHTHEVIRDACTLISKGTHNYLLQ